MKITGNAKLSKGVRYFLGYIEKLRVGSPFDCIEDF
tara:strand:- start:25 stop:132 length:108 start_codon:yes stop_codon:yes gene_type:complete